MEENKKHFSSLNQVGQEFSHISKATVTSQKIKITYRFFSSGFDEKIEPGDKKLFFTEVSLDLTYSNRNVWFHLKNSRGK